MEACGLIWGIGGGPFLVQKEGFPVMGTDVEYECEHWATRIEGLEAAWESDTNQENRAVQMSVQAGLHHCTVFVKQTPALIRRWLKELGNSENHSATVVTFLEKMRSTETVEKVFNVKKRRVRGRLTRWARACTRARNGPRNKPVGCSL